MRTNLILGAVGALALLGGCSASADTSAAEAGVAEFRQMLGAGRYAEIYRASANEMRSTTSEAQFTGMLSAVHARLGEFRSANRTGWNWNTNNGVTMVTLNYDAQYAAGEATERFIYRVQGGRAALAGLNINSPALTAGNPGPAPADGPMPGPDK